MVEVVEFLSRSLTHSWCKWDHGDCKQQDMNSDALRKYLSCSGLKDDCGKPDKRLATGKACVWEEPDGDSHKKCIEDGGKGMCNNWSDDPVQCINMISTQNGRICEWRPHFLSPSREEDQKPEIGMCVDGPNEAKDWDEDAAKECKKVKENDDDADKECEITASTLLRD